ncbi:MAG: endonuclease MutS2 [Spirulinaceae cyanobacterium SM2_1_0]|nr:endonuclease MutS2 [Spirulinaceae cyanobacterium SM2_1_0]
MLEAETLELLEWPRLCQHLATFAATKLGAIAARQLHPPRDRATSEQLLAQTRDAYWLESQPNQSLVFEGIHDISAALERADLGGLLAGDELLAIATTLAGMRRLRRAIDEREADLTALAAIVATIRTYPELEQEIHRCIDERGDVSDRASPELADLRRQLKGTRDQIVKTLQSLIQRQSNAIQQPTIGQRGDRFVIAVKATRKDAIPGIVHDSSSTGATLFVEPQTIINRGNHLRQLQRQEQRLIEKVLRALSDQVTEVAPDLEHLLAAATALDLATARARYSLWLAANAPRFTDREETIALRQLRHPLLVWQQQHEQGAPVVPIDVQIAPNLRVIAITGPNTGGKTVALKTLGLAALMARAGLFVPAREPVELPWLAAVLADIGDEQSLQQSLSTFSGHIRRISRILNALDELAPDSEANALVLLDEVGAGTDPSEGSALATALLQHLADRARLTVATTHYGELKALKYQDPRFENASVEFDDRSLAPTYRLLWGIPGRSNALTIAERLGLPATVIAAAEQQKGDPAADVNVAIAGLEAQRQAQEAKAQQAAELLAQAEQFYQEVSERAANLQAREQQLKQEQEQAVNAAIAEAKREIAQVIRELQAGPQRAQRAQQATAAVENLGDRYRPAPAKPKPGYRPQVGERVRLPRLGQTAEVLELPAGNTEAVVRFGLMKMSVPLSDLESLDGKKVESPPPATAKASAPAASPQTVAARPLIRTERNTIDLRGARVMDAEADLEQAIAAATETGALWIIHGKGTGRLRQGIHEFLQTHPQVDRFELAPQNEGGAGVTVVHLR